MDNEPRPPRSSARLPQPPSSMQYAELEEALVKHGGVLSGRGIQNNEEALMRRVVPRWF